MFCTALGVEDKSILPGITNQNEAKVPPKEKEDKETADSSCSCTGTDDGRSRFSESEAEQLIEFEDALHNTVYVK